MPFAAGSGTDTVARIIQPQLSAALGEQVVIDNRPGAAGNLGAQVAAAAPADGYTVFMGISSHSISMTLRAISCRFRWSPPDRSRWPRIPLCPPGP